MVIAFDSLPPQARIWVYQSPKPLTSEAQHFILQTLNQFIAEWKSHNQPVIGSAAIFHNQFIVIGADESAGQVSGCGVDSLVSLLKSLGQQLNLDFFGNDVAFIDNGQVHIAELKTIRQAIQSGLIKPETPVFDNSITEKSKLDQWPRPAAQSWLARYFAVLLLFFGIAHAQTTCYYNAILHLGNGSRIEKGFLSFSGDKITAVGQGEDPQADQRIDAEGAHLYPALILLNNTIGLRETDALRATLDFAETGELNPEVQAASAFNHDSEIIPTLRQNGVLIVQSTPRGKLLAGNSAVLPLSAKSCQPLATAQHLYWQTSKIPTLDALLGEARSQPSSKNLKIMALQPVLAGSQPLFIHTQTHQEALKAIHWAQRQGIKMVLVCRQDVIKIADFLAAQKIPVVLPRVFSLPESADAPVDAPFTLPKTLLEKGVLCALSYEGDMEAMGARNLAFSAGYLAAYGLDKELALKLITLNAATILGLDDQLGSLEVGKQATFFISTGDALDMMSQNVIAAFIAGQPIPLTSRQQSLYQSYRTR